MARDGEKVLALSLFVEGECFPGGPPLPRVGIRLKLALKSDFGIVCQPAGWLFNQCTVKKSRLGRRENTYLPKNISIGYPVILACGANFDNLFLQRYLSTIPIQISCCLKVIEQKNKS